jgi:hypothetical protein
MKHNILKRLMAGILILIAVTAMAQNADDEVFVPTYSLGDQTLSINLGLFIPLFFAGGPDGVARSNLTLGAAGSIAWSSYITNEFKLGAEVGGSFALTPNRRALCLVPITANASYIFQAFPFEFPVSLGLGISFARIEDLLKLDPIVRPGVGAYWNYSSQWAFGANLRYWLIPQIYTDRSPTGSGETRIGNFLELTLSALYRF